MELKHQFSVPVGIEEAWAHFNDIATLAQCFPGAQVTEADAESFSGSVKVKLGPIALQYLGTGTFVEKDEAAKRFVVDAKGKDKRGNGTAGAQVTVSMTDAGGATDITVDTDLAITGKPAQFGRGVMQDVSDKLLGQFVSCLEDRLTAAPAEPAAASTEAAAPVTGAEPAAAVTGAGDADPTPAPAASAPKAPAPAPASEPEALDLGATVLPILLKSYWKQGVGAVVVIAVVVWLLGRR